MAQALHISEIQLLTILKGKLGEKEAEQLVTFIKAETEKQADEKYKYFSKDLENLKKEIIAQVEVRLAEMTGRIADIKAEMIKWMFVFVFTSTLATIGSIIAIIKFVK